MKKNAIKIGLLFSILSLSSFAYADEEKYEIFFNGLAGLNFNFAATQSTSVNFYSATILPVTLSHFVTHNLEVDLTPTFSYTSGAAGAGSSTLGWGGLVGFTYSFMDDILNSPFFQAGIGYGGASYTTSATSATTTTNGLMWGVAAGKRFKIVDHVAYVPEVSYLNSAAAGTTVGTLSIVPLQFSVLF